MERIKRGTPLTVSQLIYLLESADPDMPVQTEGCDCWGEAGGVSIGSGRQPWHVGKDPDAVQEFLLITRAGEDDEEDD